MIEEELAWGCSGIQTSLGCNGLATRADRARRLGGAQEGVPRPAHRGAAARLLLPDRARRRLRRLGDEDDRHPQGDKWVINGSKCFITNGELRQLVHGLREDRQGRRPPRHLGVHRPARRGRRRGQEGGQDGPACLEHRDHLLQRRRDSRLDTCVGEENKGFKLAMMTLDRTRPGVAAMATGIARAAFEFATDYSQANASSSACRSRCTRRSSS